MKEKLTFLMVLVVEYQYSRSYPCEKDKFSSIEGGMRSSNLGIILEFK